MSNLSRNIIAIAVFVLIVAGIIVYGVTRHTSDIVPEGSIGNTSSNLTAGGKFAEAEGKVFFANPYNDNCLYACDADGSNVFRLCDLKAAHINAAGNKVFFFGERVGATTGLGSVAGKPGIFSIDADGNHLSQVTANTPMNMLLVGNEIYYSNTNTGDITFDKYDLKEKKNTVLLPHGIEAFSYTPGYIYYGGRGENLNLYLYEIGLNVESVIWEGIVYDPVYYDGFIYYMDVMNDYRLCRYSPSTNTIEVLTDDRLDFFNLYGSVIFYQKSSQTSPELRRMALNGANNELIAEGVYSNLSLTSQYAYFTEFGHDVPLYRTPTYGSPYITEFTEAKEAAFKAMTSVGKKKSDSTSDQSETEP